jgi:beta-glucosidase-like glycosyl hydrolase
MTSLEFCNRARKLVLSNPFVTGSMAVPYIQAIQSHGIIGMSKHFVAND